MRKKGVRWKCVQDPRLRELQEGRTVRVVIGGHALCFVRKAGVLHALADHCPHQGRTFENATCEEGYLICPWHRMSFDPATGRNRYGMTEAIQVFPVEEEEGEVRVGLPHRTLRLFGLRLW